MASRNDITGDELRSKTLSREGKENHKKIFGEKPIQRGSWVYDSKLRKLVPKHAAQSSKPKVDIFVDNMEAYDSPISGKVVKNRRERDMDLKANGCRPYEGLKTEQIEANNWQQEQDTKLNESIHDTAARTLYEINHGYRQIN